MSILQQPVEILEEILNYLPGSDLKSLRLTQRALGKHASGYLSWKLLIDFDGGDTAYKMKGTAAKSLLKRVTALVGDVPAGAKLLDGAKIHELAITFDHFTSVKEVADAFEEFALDLVDPLLNALGGRVGTLHVHTSNYAVNWSHDDAAEAKVNATLDIFHESLKEWLEESKPVVGALDFRSAERHVPSVASLTSLRSLSFDIREDSYGDYSCRNGGQGGLKAAEAMFRTMAGLLVGNADLQSLRLRYEYPHVGSLQGPEGPDFKEVSDLIFDKIPEDMVLPNLKRLDLGTWMHLGSDVRNVSKLKRVEYLKTAPNTDRDYDQKRKWVVLKDAGVCLTDIKLNYCDSVTDEFLDYLLFAAENGAGIRNIKFPGRVDPERLGWEPRLRITQEVMPLLYHTLRRLDISTSVVIVNEEPDIVCPLLKPLPGNPSPQHVLVGRGYSPATPRQQGSETIHELMQILRPCSNLEMLVINVNNFPGTFNWKTRLCDRWRVPRLENDATDWKAGMMLKFKYKASHRRGRGVYKLRVIWNLVKDKGDWIFKYDKEYDAGWSGSWG